jgi:carboxypeptidase D
MMCAHTGIEAMIANMTFNGAKGFNDTKGSSSWSVDGRQIGEWTTARNLTYVRFYNASRSSLLSVHFPSIFRLPTILIDMVPLDELLASHDMILRFLAVDTLYAAGESASIPSNIGDETASVLNPVAPNGTTLASSTKNSTALDSESSETLDKLSGLDRSHEAYYGPRRSFGLFLLLTIVVLLIWSFLKWRTSRRKARNGRKSRYGRLNKNDGKRRSRKGVGRGGIRLTGGELERRSENGELKRNLSIVREVEEVEDEEEKEGKLYHEGKVLFELGEEEEDEDELLRESEEFDGDIGGTTSNPWKASI